MSMSTMTMASMRMVMEKQQSHEIRKEAETANDEDEFGVLDFLRFDETLDGFEEDGHAQCDEEDAVDEGS